MGEEKGTVKIHQITTANERCSRSQKRYAKHMPTDRITTFDEGKTGSRMSPQELIPALRELPRVEKLRLVQFLVNELTREAALTPLEPHAEYPVWSPYDANEAAETLLKMLEQEKSEFLHGI